MAEREYVKTHEFDRVLHYFWAEQELSSGIFDYFELAEICQLEIRPPGGATGKTAEGSRRV